ncbi:Similar to UBX domain-containing protein 7; acc. no. P38349 [Pyronema omphalodes CBS 100304]|uniref:Similar to UBX domain-containing protein 7 acc. no. P38349 n=1 Tax=Pyronema omphalodes (strain CBS 100304) TaxID=1076935 RepID=U4LSI6_PYROM|nr:Similar to UBX domain-containing protein 7; acc. no. P38349 [Pyronema omphalodes CBS 100304]
MSTSPERTSIFYSGTVHEAIATSVQQRLSLVCFVTDGGEEASIWESEYLLDSEVFESLKTDAILLRLQAGSEDAGLLAAVCPVEEIPHLLVTRGGTLLLQLKPGVSRQEFTSSLKSAIARPPASTRSPTASVPQTQVQPQSQPLPQLQLQTQPQPQPQSQIQAQIQTHTPTQTRSGPSYAQNTPLTPAPAASPISHGNPNTPIPTTPATPVGESSVATSHSHIPSYLEQQRQKKQAEKAERERILQRLENDKAERRARDRERRGTLVTPTQSSRPQSLEPLFSAEIALSFRLTDGTNIKSRFSSSVSLGTEVRAWLDQNREDGRQAYDFVEILSPSNNRSLGISDETLPLSSLFKRSATLVLVPTQTYTSAAYENPSISSHTILSQAYGLISGALDAVWRLGSFAPRTEETPPPPPRRQTLGGDPRRAPPGRSAPNQVRTLRDQGEEKDERKYYNGNQLSFEPKPDGN